MPKPRIRSPSLRRLPDPMTIRRDLGAVYREAELLRSLLRIAERLRYHVELIESADSNAKEPNP